MYLCESRDHWLHNVQWKSISDSLWLRKEKPVDERWPTHHHALATSIGSNYTSEAAQGSNADWVSEAFETCAEKTKHIRLLYHTADISSHFSSEHPFCESLACKQIAFFMLKKL